LEQVQELPHPQVALEQQALLGIGGAPVVFLEKSSNLPRCLVAKLEFYQEAGHLRVQAGLVRSNDIVQDVGFTDGRTVRHEVILTKSISRVTVSKVLIVRRAGEFAAEETDHGIPESAGEGDDNKGVRSEPGWDENVANQEEKREAGDGANQSARQGSLHEILRFVSFEHFGLIFGQ